VRNIKPEDTQKIQLLLKRALGNDIHFVRDVSFTEYFMRFPGVSKDSIFVAETNSEVVGFCVLSVVDEMNAKIAVALELQCLDSQSFSALVRTIMTFCSYKNLDAVIVPPPPPLANLRLLGDWLRVETGVMMVRPVSFSTLIRILLDGKRELFEGKKIVLEVDREEITINSLIRGDKSHGTLGKRETRISMSSITLVKIIFDQASPLACLLKRKIKVNGISGARLALEILNTLRLENAVYVSPGDRV
jgi:hypothetical protein